MIIGRLDQKCISFRSLIQQKPVWRLCFDWLRQMPKDLPYGRYDLDNQIITALYFQLLDRGSENERINKSDSTVQIHYVVEGAEEIHLINWASGLIGQIEGGTQLIGSPKIKIKQNSGDFVILFPSDHFFGRTSSLRGKHLKKIVVSMPVQRVV